MGSELGIIVTAIIFLTLVLLLSSTFDMDGSELSIIDVDGDVIAPERPFNTGFANMSDEEVADVEAEEEGIEWQYVIGGILVIVTAVMLPVGAIGTLIISGIGGLIVLDEFTSGAVSGVMGAILHGVNWVATAFADFGGLVAYELPIIGGLSIIGILLMFPVVFIFFYFFVKVVRGI